MLRLCLVLTLLSLPVAAQKKPRPPVQQTAWPIASLSVEGNNLFSDAQILKVSGLKIGQTAGKDDFEGARDTLLATGAFASVGYRFEPAGGTKGYAASLQIDEIKEVFPYRFESLAADGDKLRAYLRDREPLFIDKIPGTDQLLKRMAGHIQEYMAKSGQPEEVIGRVSQEPSGELMILFRPAFLPSVAEVHFKDNALIGNPELQRTIAGTAVGSVYTEQRFRQIIDNTVRKEYEQKGRLRVSFPNIETKPAAGIDGLVVTVHVNEGPEYTLGEVELTGPMQGNKELLKRGTFRTGDVANYTQVMKGVEEMLQSLRRNGYLKATARTDRTINDKEKSVDVTVQIDPGTQFRFGKLTIEGLDIQTEPHLRKLWAMKSGEPFNVEYPNYFLSRLKSDQLFDNLGEARSVVETDAAKETVDVTLVLKGGKEPKKEAPDRDVRSSPTTSYPRFPF